MPDLKWAGWDDPITITSRLVEQMDISERFVTLLRSGTYKFNDGTTQGWGIDQLYDTYDINPHTKPQFDALTKTLWYGFTLTNYHNLGLAASAYPFITPGSPVKSFDFYLESPDLAGNADWAGVKGYSCDVQRNFFTWCGDDPDLFRVQLQALFKEEGKTELTPYAEWNPATNEHVMQPVKSFQPYRFTLTGDAFGDPKMTLRRLRVRFTQPNLSQPGAGECLPKGDWLLGNVTPEF